MTKLILFYLLALLVILVSGKILTFVQHYISNPDAHRDFPKVGWEVQRYLVFQKDLYSDGCPMPYMRGLLRELGILIIHFLVTLERPFLCNHSHGSLLYQVQFLLR
ncbi:hypothetical protein EJB05_47108 [Eragrostis curvula]|uniref:Uncharacterized protein n=1 Tax=Eragrostis curvula TaxID=38414 RepID=A0A5J9T7W0_9POAL|nr:hypothetical protein EJB05_47108 [Eragrostis curvula]